MLNRVKVYVPNPDLPTEEEIADMDFKSREETEDEIIFHVVRKVYNCGSWTTYHTTTYPKMVELRGDILYHRASWRKETDPRRTGFWLQNTYYGWKSTGHSDKSLMQCIVKGCTNPRPICQVKLSGTCQKPQRNCSGADGIGQFCQYHDSTFTTVGNQTFCESHVRSHASCSNCHEEKIVTLCRRTKKSLISSDLEPCNKTKDREYLCKDCLDSSKWCRSGERWMCVPCMDHKKSVTCPECDQSCDNKTKCELCDTVGCNVCLPIHYADISNHTLGFGGESTGRYLGRCTTCKNKASDSAIQVSYRAARHSETDPLVNLRKRMAPHTQGHSKRPRV